MSGYADDASVLEAVASTGVRCVSKPFTIRTLLDAVHEALSKATLP
jgi:CheY-like chemotaxis protein